MYDVGTLCEIQSVIGTDKTGYKIYVEGLTRFKCQNVTVTADHLTTSGKFSYDVFDYSLESNILFTNVKLLIQEVAKLLPEIDISINRPIQQIQEQDEMIYVGASYLKLDIHHMQKLLEEESIAIKMEMLLEWLAKEKEILLLEKDIKDKVGKSLSKSQRDALLREQLKAIKAEFVQS